MALPTLSRWRGHTTTPGEAHIDVGGHGRPAAYRPASVVDATESYPQATQRDAGPAALTAPRSARTTRGALSLFGWLRPPARLLERQSRMVDDETPIPRCGCCGAEVRVTVERDKTIFW